jgi:hypothetical protein
MMPIKQIPKNDTDKLLEQNLRAEIKKAASNNANNNLTTLSMFAERPVATKQKLAYEPIRHAMTTENPIFDKQVTGKKIPVQNTNTNATLNTIPNLALILNANKNLIPNLQSQKIETTKSIVTLVANGTQNDKIAMQKQVFNQIIPPTSNNQSKLISPTPIYQSTTQIPKQTAQTKLNIPIQLPKPVVQLPNQKIQPQEVSQQYNTTKNIIPPKKNNLSNNKFVQSNPIKPESKFPKPMLPPTNKPSTNDKQKPKNVQKYDQKNEKKYKPKTLTYSNLTVISKCQKCKQ